MPYYESKTAANSSREPSPNRDSSEPDVKAVGENQLNIAEWRTRAGIDVSQQIHLVKLAHMRYQHPDLAEITVFLRGKCVPVSSLSSVLFVEDSPSERGPLALTMNFRLWYASLQEGWGKDLVSRLWKRSVRLLCTVRSEEVLGWHFRGREL